MGNSHVDVQMCLKRSKYLGGFAWCLAFNKDNSLLFVAAINQKIYVIDWIRKKLKGEVSYYIKCLMDQYKYWNNNSKQYNYWSPNHSRGYWIIIYYGIDGLIRFEEIYY